MRRSSVRDRDRRSGAPLSQRIERAAGRMNPYLLLIAIGLVVLNLIVLASLWPHLSVTRRSAAGLAAPPAAGSIITPTVNAALRSGT